MSKNIRSISARQAREKTLFEAVNELADKTGSPSIEQLSALSNERLVSTATLLGTVSFYDFLKADNLGKKAYVCTGTSCMLSGKQTSARTRILKQLSESQIGEAVCLGRCYECGSYQIGNRTFDDRHDPDKEASEDNIPVHSESSHGVLTDKIGDIKHFYTTIDVDPATIINELSLSKLRGRGGAGFLFADKLAACSREPAGEKYIVCNGDEGDPGAFSDRYLMEQQPHRVLAGMLAAGIAAGADSGFIYVRAEYPMSVAVMTKAIEAFEKTATFNKTGFHFRVIRGAGSYICGEETALLNSIEGLRPEVRTRPPYPAQEGLFGRPTVLSNVETFAAVPWILENGGKTFADIGTEKSTGTKLLSLNHGFNKPGVHEVDMGTTLQQVVDDYGGGFRSEMKALQVGGPLGSVVPVDRIKLLTLDFESFEKEGFLLGHAGIIAIPEEFPMIDLLRHLFSFMAAESCGKCLPCRLGTEKGARMLDRASADNPINKTAFNDLLETLELGSLCGLGGGLPLPVRNIMTFFHEEVARYFH